jgi:hypothetical protein
VTLTTRVVPRLYRCTFERAKVTPGLLGSSILVKRDNVINDTARQTIAREPCRFNFGRFPDLSAYNQFRYDTQTYTL